MPADDPAYRSLETELHALRAELEWLRAERVEKAAVHAVAARYQQSQVRFRTVFEHSPLGHKIIDAELRIRQANPALAALLGVANPAALVGRRILEFAHPDYRADWNLLQQQLWAHQLPSFALETCLVRADGTACWCRVTSVLIDDEQGPMGYTTLEDISDRNAAQAALQQRETETQQLRDELAQRATDQYQALFLALDQGFCTVEVLFDAHDQATDYRFLEANPAFVRQTGLEHAVGRTKRELAPAHEAFWFTTYGHVARTGQAQRFEHEAVALGKFYEVYAFRIGDSAENRVAILFQDVLPRKRAEQALVRHEAEFRAVANLVPDLLWRSNA